MDKPIQILIVDDQVLIRQGLRILLNSYTDITVAGEAANGKEAVQLARLLTPDIILLDLIMPDFSGIDTLSAILDENPLARVIILSAVADRERVLAAIKLGAVGYLLKTATPAELVNAIRSAHEGGIPLNPHAANTLIQTLGHPANVRKTPDNLTQREEDVLRLIAQGKSNREIAEEMGLAVATVRTYSCAILKKLQLSNRTQAGLYYLKQQSQKAKRKRLAYG